MLTPYLTFAGDCRAALAFYQSVFSTAPRMLQPYGDYAPAGIAILPADLPEWVLHAEMEICGTVCWLADEIAEPVAKGNHVKLTATVPAAQEARRIYDALKAGAHITLPPTETFYSAFHAGLTDRFGVSWNIVAEEAPAAAPAASAAEEP